VGNLVDECDVAPQASINGPIDVFPVVANQCADRLKRSAGGALRGKIHADDNAPIPAPARTRPATGCGRARSGG